MKEKIVVCLLGAIDANAVGHIKNINRFLQAETELINLGFMTFNPAADILIGMFNGTMEYNDYAERAMVRLEKSDCGFLVPGWENSKGTKAEIELAKKLGIPVFESHAGIISFSKGDWRRQPTIIGYEHARGLMEELWKAFSSMVENVTKETGDVELVNDNDYYKRLRKRLFDFGVRGIAGFDYAARGDEGVEFKD